MTERRGPRDESWDQYADLRFAANSNGNGANGTGKRRAVPGRSSGVNRESHPPVTSVDSPDEKPGLVRRWGVKWVFLGLLGLLLVCGLCAFVLFYAGANFIQGVSKSSDAASVAGTFLASVSAQDYNQAYSYLGPPFTEVPNAQSTFTQQAQQDDHCYGTVTDYTEVPNSAVQPNEKLWTFSYTITRTKLHTSYQLKLTIQQDNQGQWQITGYTSDGKGNDLGPTQPTCS